MTAEERRCYLIDHRDEVITLIQNGLETAPEEMRSAILDELYGEDRAAHTA